MATTITTTMTATTTLSTASQNPFSVASSGYINVSTGSGIYSKSAISWSITNAGRIRSTKSGTTVGGAFLTKGGAVTNLTGATISGVSYGVYLNGTSGGTITNSGTISATGASGIGVRIKAANATLINAGKIAAASASGTAVSLSGSGDLLVLKPGFAFTGKIAGASSGSATDTNTLELAGTSAATLSGFGINFSHFGTTTVDAGANWTLAGSGTLAAGFTLTNYGTLTNTGVLNASAHAYILDRGLLTNIGTIAFGNGLGGNVPLKISNGGTLINQAGGLLSGGTGVFIVTEYGDNNTVTNLGSIAPGTYGVGVYIKGSHNTLIDGGTIGGAGSYVTAVNIEGDYNRIIVDPNAVFDDQVFGDFGHNALEFAGATGGTADLNQLAGFGSTTIDAGATWTLTGPINGSVVNYGVLYANSYLRFGYANLANHGLIQGYVDSFGNDTFTNLGTITSTDNAVGVVAGDVVVNDGTVQSDATGIYAINNVSVTNQADAVIAGIEGIYDATGPVTVANAGTILGTGGSGYGAIGLLAGGYVTNSASGLIAGHYGVFFQGAAGTLVNQGVIQSDDNVAVQIDDGGTVTNLSGGTIIGVSAIADGGSAGVTITNVGTIASSDGAGGSAVLFGSGDDRLIIDPSAVFIGVVDGGSGNNSLELAGTELATLSGLGTSFQNFGTVDVDAGADWALTDTLTAGVTLVNAGTVGNVQLASGAGGVVVETGAVFVSTVEGGGEASALELAAASGTFSGSRYDNFGSVLVEANANWTFPGTIASGVTLINAGIVDNVQLAVGDGRVVAQAGAVFSGSVQGGGAASALELAGIGGSFDNLNAQFSNFGSIVVDTGAAWTLTGTTSLAADDLLIDGGTLIDAGTFDDAGSISGGITLGSGASLNNSGTISNATDSGNAVTGIAGAGTVSNGGTIIEAGASGVGLHFTAGGTVTNSAYIGGSQLGLLIAGVVGSVSNTGGTIEGASGAQLNAGGTLTNAGSVIGTNGVGVYLASGGGVTNTATGAYVGGSQVGVLVGGANGIVMNAAGTIEGGIGVGLASGGTLINAGSIIGTSGTAVALAGAAARVVIDPGAVFDGAVVGRAGDTLELAGSSVATLTGLGSAGGVSGFGSATIDADATWSLSGSFGGTLINSGTLNENGEFIVNNDGSLANDGLIQGYLLVGTRATVTNRGTITGTGNAIGVGNGGATIVNDGLISAGTTGNGINLGASSTITNNASGVISGRSGVYHNDTGTVVNAGTIIGTGTTGYGAIGLRGGGNVTNIAGGQIQGQRFGVFMQTAAGTLSNQGTITAAIDSAVYFGAGGSVTNTSDGLIITGAAFDAAVEIGHGGAGGVGNAGTIAGAGYGVELDSSSTVVNVASGADIGTIAGGRVGILADTGSVVTINNTGVIQGSGATSVGIYLRTAGGTITNGASNATGAVIQGVKYGIRAFYQAVTVTNYGTIVGATGFQARDSGTPSNNTVVDTGTIESTSGTAGTAVKFAGGNDRLVVDPGAVFIGGVDGSSGSNILELASAAGTGTLTGIGTQFVNFSNITIDANAAWSVGLANPAAFAGTISGFSSADTLDLSGITGVTSTDLLSKNVLQISRTSGGPIDIQLDPTQDFTGQVFHHTAAGSDTLITEDDVACFVAGTLIRTDRGEIPVEDLSIGDCVVTLSGRVRPIIWIGHRHINLVRHPDPVLAQPIRILPDAIADGAPCRDLLVSPDHALCIDGQLIPARLLVNDATIQRETRCRQVTYYHVELDAHDVLLADGLAAESYLDTGNRGMFANGTGPIILHPDLSNDQARRDAESCAPFVSDAARVEPIWRRLAERAVLLGKNLPDAPQPAQNAELRVKVGERYLRAISVDDDRYVFVLPSTDQAIRLVSRVSVPSDAQPWIDDRRRLGVMVKRLTLRMGAEIVPIPLDHPALTDGWWDVEWHGRNVMRRWTDGNAMLPVGLRGPALLEIEVAGTRAYPVQAMPAVVPMRRIA